MRYNQFRKMDVANGPGIRLSLFTQGCHFHCPGCFNSSTWDFTSGKLFTTEVANYILDAGRSSHIAGLSLLGGEPLAEENKSELLALCKRFKELYPNKTIWCWTGYEWEDVQQLEILKYIDVLIVGKYIDTERDISSNNLWRGSRNQRVIAVQKSIVAGDKVYLEGIPNNN